MKLLVTLPSLNIVEVLFMIRLLWLLLLNKLINYNLCSG